MFSLRSDPHLPNGRHAGVFVQTVELTDRDRAIGRAIWSAADPEQGVVQLIEIQINPTDRRAGNGRRLLRGVIEQAREYHRIHQRSLRRLWAGVGHKSNVVGRAFLTSEGFHHISTTGGLLKDEDQLIYVKSLD